MKKKEILLGGIVNNPILVLVLGMCPAMAQTNTFANAVGLGVATMLVLIVSCVVISTMRRIIPNSVRIPVYIVIIATIATLVQMSVRSYMPELYAAIGTSLSLIVVNCVIMERCESFASKNNPLDALLDSLSMGAGFCVVLAIIGGIRELLGSQNFAGIAIFSTTAGGFLVLALLMALYNYIFDIVKKKKMRPLMGNTKRRKESQ